MFEDGEFVLAVSLACLCDTRAFVLVLDPQRNIAGFMSKNGFTKAAILIATHLFVCAAEETSEHVYQDTITDLGGRFPAVLEYVLQYEPCTWATSQKGYVSFGVTRSNSAGTTGVARSPWLCSGSP